MDLLQIQEKLVPDILEVMEKRYIILKNIFLMQPVGRRSLADSIGWTERILRSEVEFLKRQGLVDIQNNGMNLTKEGYEVLDDLYPYIKKSIELHNIEKSIKDKLAISEVTVVAGDSDKDKLVKKEMGRVATKFLNKLIEDNDTVAITGGSTVAEVVEMMPEINENNSVLFIPARGGIGENHEYLANTLASKIAKKMGQSYRLLHIPDQMSEDTYKSLMNEKNIQDYLNVIKSVNLLIHGIGNAKKMAIRRNSSQEILNYLYENDAVGEALGYYFSSNGEVVHKINSIGLRLDDLENIPKIIAIAGGESKADAILAVLKNNYRQILITDEGAAKKILTMI